MTAERLLWLGLAGTLARLWLFPVSFSFWLDETLIASAVKSGPADFLDTWDVRYQSIAYMLVAWVFSLAAGTSEVALRLPSIVAAAASLVCFYRLGVRFKDRNLGIACAVLFACLPHVVVEVPNARPYALALFCSIAALGSLHRPRRWALFGVAAAYLHNLFILPMLLQGMFILRRPQGKAVFAVSLAALVPLAPVLLQFARMSSLFSYPEDPSLTMLSIYLMAGPPVAVAVAIALCFGAADRSVFRSEAVRVGLVTGAVPVLALYVAATVFGVPVFVDRYLLAGAPGVVLFWAALAGSIHREAIRVGVLAIAIATVNYWSVPFGWVPAYRSEDWRGSAARIEPGLTLLHSGLAETWVADWLKERRRWPHLAAPAVVYRKDANPENTWLIPFFRTPEGEEYVDSLLDAAEGQGRINLWLRAFPHGREWFEFARERLGSRGFALRSVYQHGRVALAIFERPRRED